MVGGSSSISSNLNSAYASTTQALSDALTKLASGKKFQNAGEDLVGYIRSTNLQSDIDSYQSVKQNLTAAKTYTAAAVEVGSAVYEKLTDMKNLAKQYAATTDTDEQAEITAEFNAIKTDITTSIANATVDGTAVYAAANVKTVDIDPEGTDLDIAFTSVASAAALDVTAAGAEAAVQTQMDTAIAYLGEAKSFDGIIDQQMSISDTIMTSKKAVLSLITDIDEARGMNDVVDLGIRQQAAVSMLAQGNMAQGTLAQLFE